LIFTIIKRSGRPIKDKNEK